MPYITKDDRDEIDRPHISVPGHKGGLTYVLTQKCLEYAGAHRTSFDTYGDIIAALECAKLEFYRRMLAPYEDKKIKENGDVYP